MQFGSDVSLQSIFIRELVEFLVSLLAFLV